MKSVAQQLATHMKRECALLSEFHEAETTMKQRIGEKDWNGLEAIIGEMTRLADDLVDTENLRHAAFERLRLAVGESRSAGFYQVVVHLSSEDRAMLAGLYRTMKLSVLGVRATGCRVDQHARTINETLHDVLGELYPHRKGNLYSAHGSKIESGSNPLIVDREL